jgi:DNA repair protein RadD
VSGFVPQPPGPGFALRPYQEAAIDQIGALFRAGVERVLFVMPTGSGKTVLFCHAGARAVLQNGKVLIIVHRRELVEQTSETVRQMGLECGVIVAGCEGNVAAPVQIALINTLVQRVKAGQYCDTFNLVIIDEAHHVVAPTWLATIPLVLTVKGFVLGVSATPLRLDGRGLDWFQKLLIGPDYPELYEGGFLVKATTYAPAVTPDLSRVRSRGGDYITGDLEKIVMSRTLIGDAVEHYRKLASGRPALVYCCSVAHSKQTANEFCARDFRAMHIDGDTDDDVRRAAIAGLANGNLDVLTNCGLFSEGVDVPVLGCVIVLRPTQSLALHKQMCGRALRPAPGTCDAIIIDHTGNSLVHGCYDFPHLWTLSGKRPGEAGDGEAPARQCPNCGAVNNLGAWSLHRVRPRV